MSSGYDFGYLLKVLSCEALPSDEGSFFDLLKLYFPRIYDIKHIMRHCKNLKGGLQDVADDLGVTVGIDGWRHRFMSSCARGLGGTDRTAASSRQ